MFKAKIQYILYNFKLGMLFNIPSNIL